MSFKVFPGVTIKLPKPDNDIPHLWIVLTQPEGDQAEVIFVNLTSRNNLSDTTVILGKGDHPFIKHDSVINYEDARIVTAESLIKAVESGLFHPHAYFNDNILSKIQAGLLKSDRTPNDIKNFYRSITI